jgi:hypothetical protein
MQGDPTLAGKTSSLQTSQKAAKFVLTSTTAAGSRALPGLRAISTAVARLVSTCLREASRTISSADSSNSLMASW